MLQSSLFTCFTVRPLDLFLHLLNEINLHCVYSHLHIFVTGWNLSSLVDNLFFIIFSFSFDELYN